MKIIYVSGPMSGATRWETEKNCRALQKVALRLMQEGWAPIVPCWMGDYISPTGFVDDREFWEKIIVGADCEVIKRCDAIMMCKNWTKSAGARKEWETATEAGIEILFDDGAEIFVNGGVKL